jgi:hypothetical protein
MSERPLAEEALRWPIESEARLQLTSADGGAEAFKIYTALEPIVHAQNLIFKARLRNASQLISCPIQNSLLLGRNAGE